MTSDAMHTLAAAGAAWHAAMRAACRAVDDDADYSDIVALMRTERSCAALVETILWQQAEQCHKRLMHTIAHNHEEEQS